MFDDQHQPMSSWLNKLAENEGTNMTSTDLKDESVAEKSPAKFAGISSTWNKKSFQDSAMTLEDSSRQVKNKTKISTPIEVIEKHARKLMMSGLNVEKIANVLKHQYDEKALNIYMSTRLASLESEFGKLGSIYVDASLVEDCNDISTIMATSNKISGVAVRDVKRSAKCDDCNFNKKSNCLKLGLNVVEESQVKTVKEAKSIINKFASLKYVNSYFVKSEDLTGYYNRLASENPEKVVTDFLTDINNRRTAKQETNARLAASETSGTVKNNKDRQIKLGKCDTDVESAFKQFLLANPSLRTAKSEITKRYGEERINAYLKEAKDDINKYIRFVTKTENTDNVRVSSANESDAGKIENKLSSSTIDAATKMAYTMMTFRQPIEIIKKAVVKTYGQDVSDVVINKLATDKEAQLLGLTYIDSSFCSSVSELKQIHDSLSKKANTIFQVKESSICNMENNPSGICSITGLKIVKSASLDSKKQALKFVKHAKVCKIANDFDLNKLESKLTDDNNGKTIKAFIVSSSTNTKRLSENVIREISDAALKYAKDISIIRRIATMRWTSTNMLVEALEPHVINKQAFDEEVKTKMNKSANDANVYLTQPNTYDTSVFTNDHKESDAILGSTM